MPSNPSMGMVQWSLCVWLSSGKWVGTTWFKSDKISRRACNRLFMKLDKHFHIVQTLVTLVHKLNSAFLSWEKNISSSSLWGFIAFSSKKKEVSPGKLLGETAQIRWLECPALHRQCGRPRVRRHDVEGPEWGDTKWKALSSTRWCGRPWVGRDEVKCPESGKTKWKALSGVRQSERPRWGERPRAGPDEVKGHEWGVVKWNAPSGQRERRDKKRQSERRGWKAPSGARWCGRP